MALIERTAYPRFRRNPAQRELVTAYALSDAEAAFVHRHAGKPALTLALGVMLKAFQRLHHFAPLSEVPDAVVRHVRLQLKLRGKLKVPEVHRSTAGRYMRRIRDFLGVRSFREGGLAVAVRTVAESARVWDNPADLINMAIEQLVRSKIELPAFSTLDRLVRRVRTLVNQGYFRSIEGRLSDDEKAELDALLVVPEDRLTSPYQVLKEEPKSGKLSHFEALAERIDHLDGLVGTPHHLEDVPEVKRRHFALECRALDAAELRDFASLKRHALVLCLIYRARIKARDDMATMFLKQMSSLHHRGQNRLQELREQSREAAETLVATMADVVDVLDRTPSDLDAGREIRALVSARGGIQALQDECRFLTAYHGDNYLPLLLPLYTDRLRRVLFRMVRLLDLTSTSEDRRLTDALDYILALPVRTPVHIDPDIDLSFATERWRAAVVQRTEAGERHHRKLLELCVFSMLALALKAGDVAVRGSEAYSDFRDALLPWDACAPQVADYCALVDLPADAAGFVNELREALTTLANDVDAQFPENSHVDIDSEGLPVLRRHKAIEMPKRARELEAAVLERMPERSIVDILCQAQHWTEWTRHFGPLSGSDPKIDEPTQRYILAGLAYGTNMGPAQAARHLRGVVSARMLSFVNRRHIDANALSKACRDVINLYASLRLPLYWGDPERAGADGTQFDAYEQNLLASRHIRYGGVGGIAYHFVSDTYIALVSKFIPCGAWEGIYILDAPVENTSDLQPTTVHADTQGQALPVFGMAYLFGIELMPRIRNWRDYRFFRPEPKARYRHIDALFKDTVDWELIERHWQDMMQVIISIKAGRLTPSALLRKLTTNSRKNRLYHALRELGSAVRTYFLLRYISDNALREQITATTNKVESYNHFSRFFFFGAEGVIRENDPIEQEKAIKYNDLIANAAILSNTIEQMKILRDLMGRGWTISESDVRFLSPYSTASIKRFGDYVIDLEARPAPVDCDLVLNG